MWDNAEVYRFLETFGDETVEEIMKSLTQASQRKINHSSKEEDIKAVMDELRGINSLERLFREWRQIGGEK